MVSRLKRLFSSLLAFLLALVCLSTSGAPAAAPKLAQPAQQQNMPDGLMSALLAASTRPFDVGADGYRARSGGLAFMLGAGGLRASGQGPSLAWGLALSGEGRGDKIAAVPAAELVQAGDRLEYRRGSLTEWYRNTALGVEQGFALRQAPPGAGPIVLQLDVTTDLAGSPDADGRGLSFAAPDRQALRYDHLRAWDANGVPLGAGLRYTSGQVRIQVNDRGAAYPITIDPLVYLEQKVIASGAANSQFGCSVALSRDGDTALVGACLDDVGTDYRQGSAYVFTRSGMKWYLEQRLIALYGAAAGDRFGTSVALSGDTALVGADGHDAGGNADQGSAYVFTRSGTTWTQEAHLVASDGAADDRFGSSVALSGDTALVGADGDDVGLKADQGSAYVFTRSGTTWTQQAQVFAPGGAANDRFGTSVALSGDGGTALVGADGVDVSANADQGSAYVFVHTGIPWMSQAQLRASDGAAGDGLGSSVALSGDGDTALVGADRDDVGANADQGSAYVFTRSWVTWSEQAHLTASDGVAEDQFGSSVALAGDTALVGASDDGVGANAGQGSAYVFTRSRTTWTQQAQLAASDGAPEDQFGASVALSGDGDTALVGAGTDDVGANSDQGSAFVFTPGAMTWNEQAQLTGSDGEASDNFGYSVALSGDTALLGADLDNVGANRWQGSAYVFTRSGTTWSLQQKLTGSDGESDDYFGMSVALDGDTALVAAPGHAVGANIDQGSVYVFTRSGTTWAQQTQLAALDGAAYDMFGSSVALWDDGKSALVGAMYDQVGTNDQQGSVYVFTRSGTTWAQQTHLTASDGAAYDWFGRSVALAGDTALVGAVLDGVGANAKQGSAYVFTRTGADWAQQAHLAASDGGAEDRFGGSVALSGDTALVGAYYHNVSSNALQGAAYVFTLSGPSWTQQAELTALDGAAEDGFGSSVALWGDMALVGASDDGVGANGSQGSAYVFTRSGTTWTQQAQLIASDGAALDRFGYSVALAADGNTMLVGAPWDEIGENFGQGSAYFFTPVFSVYLPLVLRKAP